MTGLGGLQKEYHVGVVNVSEVFVGGVKRKGRRDEEWKKERWQTFKNKLDLPGMLPQKTEAAVIKQWNYNEGK